MIEDGPFGYSVNTLFEAGEDFLLRLDARAGLDHSAIESALRIRTASVEQLVVASADDRSVSILQQLKTAAVDEQVAPIEVLEKEGRPRIIKQRAQELISCMQPLRPKRKEVPVRHT